MRVAVVTQYFPTSAQPWAGHSAYQTLKHIAQQCDLQVFYPEATYPAMLKPKTGAPANDRAWQPAGVAAQYIPYPVLPVITRTVNGWTMYRRLLPHVREWRPDVILNYVVYPDGYAAVRIGEALGVPVVLTAIGSDLNRIPDRIVGALTRGALRRANVTLAVSGDLARTARAMGAAKSRSILNGCDTTVFHPQERREARAALGVNEEAEVVLYAGRLDVRKGLRELIDAIAALRASRPLLRCYLLGDGPDRPLLQAAIGRHRLEDVVTFVPAAPTQTVAQWMATANLFTLPSYMEGCPNVVLEALAAGRPVVTTNVGGIPELMDVQSGRLVPPADASALADALDEVLEQDWSAEEIASRHHRSWEDVSRDVLAVLQRVTVTE